MKSGMKSEMKKVKREREKNDKESKDGTTVGGEAKRREWMQWKERNGLGRDKFRE